MKRYTSRISRKQRIKGGGKDEDLLRLIGTINPNVTESLLVNHDGTNPRNSFNISTSRQTRIYIEKKLNPGRTFIITHGRAGYNSENLPHNWSPIIHNYGYRLPNTYLLKIFKGSFLWSMCNIKSPESSATETSESIIKDSNICRIFGILFMRYKIINEKPNGLFKEVNISNLLDEIESLLYLFINLIFVCKPATYKSWLPYIDNEIILEIQKMEVPDLGFLFFKIISNRGIQTNTATFPISTSVISCFLSIKLNGYNYIKNLFDRAITNLYMINEPLLANEYIKRYDIQEFDKFYKEYSLGDDRLVLNLLTPSPPALGGHTRRSHRTRRSRRSHI
jgi:hypothetical protein